MNICPDPKAESFHDTKRDAYEVSFDVFYNHPGETARVTLAMPSPCIARALCNFLNDHAQKARPDRIDALAGEVKELERLRALMATHMTSLYSRVEWLEVKVGSMDRSKTRPRSHHATN